MHGTYLYVWRGGGRDETTAVTGKLKYDYRYYGYDYYGTITVTTVIVAMLE